MQRTLGFIFVVCSCAPWPAVSAQPQTTANWAELSPANSPSPRYFAASAYDAARRQIVLFGGANDPNPWEDPGYAIFAETWVWDGNNWIQKFPVHSPPALYAHAMVYDSAYAVVVLNGGVSYGFLQSDTWLWDGSDWTQTSPAHNPGYRWQHAMAYDAARRQVVLFSGQYSSNDTWVWDGTDWTQKLPANSPPQRYAHAMAYDAIRRQVVLFSGCLQQANPFCWINDTWVWDGSNWIQRNPPASPDGRIYHAMTYDSAHGQVLLFGGYDNNTPSGLFDDTWVWDGTHWLRRLPSTSPSASTTEGRYLHTLAYDAARNRAILFGGFEGAPLGDTWSWNSGLLVTASGRYDPVAHLFTGTIFVTNVDPHAVIGPFSVVFENLPPGVTVTNASGMYNGSPYLNINVPRLNPGATTQVPVQGTGNLNGWAGASVETYFGLNP